MMNFGFDDERIVHIRASPSRLARARRSHQEQHGRALRIAGDGTAEPVLRALAGQRQKHAAVFARVDVGAAGAVTARIVPRSADDDVLVAIAVDVADPAT